MTQQQNIPVGYKQSDVGVIPSDWSSTTIGASFDIRNTLRLPISEDVRKGMKGKYPYYGPTKIQDYINEYKVEGEHALIGEDGDHFLKWNSISMTQLATGKFNVNNHAHIIKGRPNTSITKWFYYYFKHRDITPHLTRQGAGRYKLSKASLSQIQCALPNTIMEQERVANVLTDIDSLITKSTQLIQKKRNIKQGSMQRLLTGKIRLPGFNAKWESKVFNSLVNIEKGSQLNKSRLEKTGTYPVWNGGIIPSGFTHKWNSPENTITISEGGNSCGFVNFCTQKFWLGGHCYAVKITKQNLDLMFLFHLLKLKENEIKSLRVGSGLPNIQKKSLYELELFYPTDINEQKALALTLSEMEFEVRAVEELRAKYINLKQGMMQQLLTGKIRLIKD